MWLKAQNEMEGLWPHAAILAVERAVTHQHGALVNPAGCPPVSFMIAFSTRREIEMDSGVGTWPSVKDVDERTRDS